MLYMKSSVRRVTNPFKQPLWYLLCFIVMPLLYYLNKLSWVFYNVLMFHLMWETVYALIKKNLISYVHYQNAKSKEWDFSKYLSFYIQVQSIWFLSIQKYVIYVHVLHGFIFLRVGNKWNWILFSGFKKCVELLHFCELFLGMSWLILQTVFRKGWSQK